MWIFVMICTLLGGVLLACARRLIAVNQQKNQAWLQVEAALQHRYAWIPRWTQVAKGLVSVEHSALKHVIEARQTAQRMLLQLQQQTEAEKPMHDWLEAEAELANRLRQLRAFVVQSPELVNHPTLAEVRSHLRGVEQNLKEACEHYNQAVRAYNDLRHRFPYLLAAKALGLYQEAILIAVEKTVAFEDVSSIT